MLRTQNRPLPAGRISSANSTCYCSGPYGFRYSHALSILNWRTAFFGSISIFIYVAVYTPLKTTKTPTISFCGCFPGANSLYVGLGSLHQLLWRRTWGLVYVTILLAISSFLGHQLGCSMRTTKKQGLKCSPPVRKIKALPSKLWSIPCGCC